MGARGTRARRRKGSRRSRWSWWSSRRHLPVTTDRPGPTIEIRRHWPRFSVFWHRMSHGRLFPEDAQILNGLDSAPCHRRHTHRWILGCVGVVGMSHRDPAIARCHSRGIQRSTPLLFCFWNMPPDSRHDIQEATQPQKAQHRTRGWGREGGQVELFGQDSRGVAMKMRPRRLSRSVSDCNGAQTGAFQDRHGELVWCRRRTSTMATIYGNRPLSALIGQVSQLSEAGRAS